MKRRIVKNVFLASSLALTLFAGSLAFTTPAKAAGATTPVLKIKKVLNLPESGVKTPAETFKFKFEKHSKNGKENLKDTLPNIGDKTVVYSATADTTDKDTAKDGKQLIKLTDDALGGVVFSEAGQFTYRVVEDATANTTDMSYSKASYLVSIFTRTGADGRVIIDNIQIKKEKKDDGTANDNLNKVEYKPGDDTDVKKSANNFVFENYYDKKDGNDNPNGTDITETDKKGFVLKKEIKGDTNPNLDEQFTFQIRLTKPTASHSSETTFKYRVVDETGAISGGEKTGTYGTDFSVVLKHGERVVFGKVLLGSKVSAQETVDGGYQQGIKTGSKLNGQAISTVESLRNGSSIGEDGENMIIFENTQQTPTGIFLNNLPFIVLALMAGIGIFFFVKNRREEEELEI